MIRLEDFISFLFLNHLLGHWKFEYRHVNSRWHTQHILGPELHSEIYTVYMMMIVRKGKWWSQSCATLCNPMDYTVHAVLQSRILDWVVFPSPGDLLNPGIKPRPPALRAYYLPAEPQLKPKNTAVGSLSLLQGIFPTQKSNQGLLHYRQILYYLSYQGSPKSTILQLKFFFKWGKMKKQKKPRQQRSRVKGTELKCKPTWPLCYVILDK